MMSPPAISELSPVVKLGDLGDEIIVGFGVGDIGVARGE